MVDVPQAGVLEAQLRNIPTNRTYEVTIYNEDQQELEDDNGTVTNPAFVNRLRCEAGVNYILVNESGDNNSSPSQYELIITFDDTDQQECNNSFDDASFAGICDTITAQLYDNGDEDFYLFEGKINESLDITFFRVPDDINIRMELYNNDRQELASTSGGTGRAFDFQFSPPVSNNYYLRVSGNRSNNKLYQFQIRDNSCQTSTSISTLLNKEQFFEVYPTITSEYLQVKFYKPLILNEYKIYNTNGYLVGIGKFDIQSNSTQIDTYQLQKGIYNICIYTNKGFACERFIKQ